MTEENATEERARRIDSEPKSIRPLLVLSLALLCLWSLWVGVLQPVVAAGSSVDTVTLGFLAQLAFWGAPSAWYLHRVWGARWLEPLGLGFPLGWHQAFRALAVTVVVALFFLMGTAAQMHVPLGTLLSRLVENAELQLTAPVLEELLFRGIIVAELLNWVHSHDKADSAGLRLRFWGGQLGAAGVFLLVHWPWWLAHHGVNEALRMSAPVFALGFILGFVFANSRSIWGCIFLHWLNNQLSLLS